MSALLNITMITIFAQSPWYVCTTSKTLAKLLKPYRHIDDAYDMLIARVQHAKNAELQIKAEAAAAA